MPCASVRSAGSAYCSGRGSHGPFGVLTQAWYFLASGNWNDVPLGDVVSVVATIQLQPDAPVSASTASGIHTQRKP